MKCAASSSAPRALPPSAPRCCRSHPCLSPVASLVPEPTHAHSQRSLHGPIVRGLDVRESQVGLWEVDEAEVCLREAGSGTDDGNDGIQDQAGQTAGDAGDCARGFRHGRAHAAGGRGTVSQAPGGVGAHQPEIRRLLAQCKTQASLVRQREDAQKGQEAGTGRRAQGFGPGSRSTIACSNPISHGLASSPRSHCQWPYTSAATAVGAALAQRMTSNLRAHARCSTDWCLGLRTALVMINLCLNMCS